MTQRLRGGEAGGESLGQHCMAPNGHAPAHAEAAHCHRMHLLNLNMRLPLVFCSLTSTSEGATAGHACVYWDVELKPGARHIGLLVHAGENKSARECNARAPERCL